MAASIFYITHVASPMMAEALAMREGMYGMSKGDC
jgi:hypothetical protein